MEGVRVLLMKLGERADAVGAQELVLVEHLGENPAEPLLVDQSHDPPLGHSVMSRARDVHGLQKLGHPAQAFPASGPSPADYCSRCHFSMTVVAHRGSSPTIDRTLSRVALPSGSRSRS